MRATGATGFALSQFRISGLREARMEQEERWSVGGPLEPGRWVRHPGEPDWGRGQVQSVVGQRVTVNFEHAGKVLVNARVVSLEVLDE